jgi:glucokinase
MWDSHLWLSALESGMDPIGQVKEHLSRELTLGVDIGGTKVAAGLVDAQGVILFQTRVPMPARGNAASGFAALERAINAVLSGQPQARAALAGIGICAPGPLDPIRGIVLNPPNLTCWRNFPLAAEVNRVFQVCAKVDNDANAAALAEAVWGAGVGFRNVFYATLGTGIGTGIVFDRRIYHGRTGSAAEGGHVSIDYNGPRCGCGKRGCIEALCSGPAIAQRARALLAKSAEPSQMREPGGTLESLTTEDVAESFRAGDALARQTLEATADLLTVWLGNMIDFLEPDVIVLGGGVARLMSEFFSRIQTELPKWCVNARCCEIPLLLAKYGSDAGIAGAAALCGQL